MPVAYTIDAILFWLTVGPVSALRAAMKRSFAGVTTIEGREWDAAPNGNAGAQFMPAGPNPRALETPPCGFLARFQRFLGSFLG